MIRLSFLSPLILVATDSGAVELATLIETTEGKTFFLSRERHRADGEGAGGAAGAAGAPRAAEALGEESKTIWKQVGETLLRGETSWWLSSS